MIAEEDSGTVGYVCSETTDVVSLTETDKKHYKTLFSSVLVSYDKLMIGDGIGQGKCTTVCSTDPIFVIMHGYLLNPQKLNHTYCIPRIINHKNFEDCLYAKSSMPKNFNYLSTN